jgi:hypothetical protein
MDASNTQQGPILKHTPHLGVAAKGGRFVAGEWKQLGHLHMPTCAYTCVYA